MNFRMTGDASSGRLSASVELTGSAPKELHVKLRIPSKNTLQNLTVNGQPATLGGLNGDTVVIRSAGLKRFEVGGRIA